MNKENKEKVLPIQIAIAIDSNKNWIAFGQNGGTEETFVETLQSIINTGLTTLSSDINFYFADTTIPIPEKKKKVEKVKKKEKPAKKKFSKKYDL